MWFCFAKIQDDIAQDTGQTVYLFVVVVIFLYIYKCNNTRFVSSLAEGVRKPCLSIFQNRPVKGLFDVRLQTSSWQINFSGMLSCC